jgi:tRNA (Thr-GGU) A37 N-methylase
VDILDSTPLLDIKPYVPRFDAQQADSIGWLKNNVHKLSQTKDDARFADRASSTSPSLPDDHS